MLRGVLHAHSTYSDGDLTLAELRETFIRDGCRFLFVTDHAEHLDEDALQRYVTECDLLSDERFSLVPGLEYACQRRMHVLGLGVTFLPEEDDPHPEEIVARIQDAGGLAVVAHPRSDHFPWIESFQCLPDGIEAWNTKYDGRVAPRVETFELVRRLRVRRSDLKAFYGLDFHWRRQYRGLRTHIDASNPTRGDLLKALSTGRYYGTPDSETFVLPADANVTKNVSRKFERRHAIHSRVRRFMIRVHRRMNRMGIRVPKWMKARIRRFF